MRWLLALVLLVPVAAAQAFEGEMEDRVGDVEVRGRRVADAPTADIVRFRSIVVEGEVEQRVTMAEPPRVSGDSIIVRSWFRDSDGSSFHVVDLEVHGDAAAGEEFRAFTRQGDFYNTSPIEAEYEVEGSEWIFRFDAAVAPDATCFLPMVYAWVPREGSDPSDQIGMAGRPCRTILEPPPGTVAPTRATGAVDARMAGDAPAVEPPGSRAPAVGATTFLAAAAIALALLAIKRR